MSDSITLPLTGPQIQARILPLSNAWTGANTFIDGSFSIVGSSDATKTIKFEVDAQTTADDLTINSGAQTDDRTLSVPVLTANATLAVLSETQTFTGAKTFSAPVSVTDATASSSPSTGALVVTGGAGIGGAVNASGNISTGVGTGTNYIFANGGTSGSSGGAAFAAQCGGTNSVIAGNKSAILGGAFDSTPYIGSSGTIEFQNGIKLGSATLLSTSVGLTNGAAAATGTLLNAPAAGNPTKWVPINDNGTTRYIPCW